MSERKHFNIPNEMPKVGTIYAHYKTGDEYIILGASLNSDTDKWHVEYKALYENPVAEKFNRELSLWTSPAIKDDKEVERYKLISE